MNRQDLLDQISAWGIIITDMHLYLDTHPSDAKALDDFKKFAAKYKELVDEFEAQFGPLSYSGVTKQSSFNWIDEPWPWQNNKSQN